MNNNEWLTIRLRRHFSCRGSKIKRTTWFLIRGFALIRDYGTRRDLPARKTTSRQCEVFILSRPSLHLNRIRHVGKSNSVICPFISKVHDANIILTIPQTHPAGQIPRSFHPVSINLAASINLVVRSSARGPALRSVELRRGRFARGTIRVSFARWRMLVSLAWMLCRTRYRGSSW